MEGVWRRVKGFLMPRRHYGGVEELREAVVQALKALGGVELKILGEGTYQNRYDLVMAAATVATLPVLVLFFFAQRQLIQGLTAGSVKG
ncbi:L-arabinose transport system permease protein AraQ [Meiothermus luteus]|uniref:L-arabinose transport system permease protein AraQ n=2 Tax=Meiothermus luteus TaxID=2026184 RepID=A0A399E9L1_9DEIN|nr:L-arabinose transport system permease protein AraQ [Meiothermus luteus]